MTKLQKLEAEILVLKDLLETSYRNVDKARSESEKADDEALEHKTTVKKLRMTAAGHDLRLIEQWKRRAETAEAKLAARR